MSTPDKQSTSVDSQADATGKYVDVAAVEYIPPRIGENGFLFRTEEDLLNSRSVQDDLHQLQNINITLAKPQ